MPYLGSQWLNTAGNMNPDLAFIKSHSLKKIIPCGTSRAPSVVVNNTVESLKYQHRKTSYIIQHCIYKYDLILKNATNSSITVSEPCTSLCHLMFHSSFLLNDWRAETPHLKAQGQIHNIQCLLNHWIKLNL